MSITVECKRCGKGYRVGDDNAGLKMKCRECESVIEIPEADFIADAEIEELDDGDFLRAVDKPAKPQAKPAPTGWRSRKVQFTGAAVILIATVGIVVWILNSAGYFGGKDDPQDEIVEKDPPASNKYKSAPSVLGITGQSLLLTDAEDFKNVQFKLTVKQPDGKLVAVRSDTVLPAPLFRGLVIRNAIENGAMPRFIQQPPPRAVGAKEFDDLIGLRLQLRRIVLAMHEYHRKWGAFPASYKRGEHLSWRVHLLPHLGEQDLYNQFRLNEPWDSKHNKSLIAKMPGVFKSKGVEGEGRTAMHVFVGPGTPFGAAPSKQTRFQLRARYAIRGYIKPDSKFKFKLTFRGETNAKNIPAETTREYTGKDLMGKTELTWEFTQKKPPVKGTPTRYRDIADSATSTLCAVIAGPETAVEWTKPGGILVDPFAERVSLGTLPKAGMPSVFFSGGFAMIPSDVNQHMLIAMIQHASGDVIYAPRGANLKYRDKSPAYIKHEEMAEQSALLQKRMVDALNKVQDDATARVAASKIEQIADSAKRLSDAKLPLMSSAEQRILKFQFDSRSLSSAVESDNVGRRALLRSNNNARLREALDYIRKVIQEMRKRDQQPLI